MMRNRGQLSEGWYDAATKKKADAAKAPSTQRRGSPDYGTKARAAHAEEQSDDDDFGPALPTQTTVGHLATGATGSEKRVGPTIPNVQDLEYRDGMSSFLLLH